MTMLRDATHGGCAQSKKKEIQKKKKCAHEAREKMQKMVKTNTKQKQEKRRGEIASMQYCNIDISNSNSNSNSNVCVWARAKKVCAIGKEAMGKVICSRAHQ